MIKKQLMKGVKPDRLLRRWWEIKTRIGNKKSIGYANYGGRGIKCEWKSFETFQHDMNESFKKHAKRHGYRNTQIERINNDGNYSKENCRWATYQEQARNRRSRVEVTFNGKTKSVKEWSEYLGIKNLTLWMRLFRYKWTIEKALTSHMYDSKGRKT